MLSELFVHNQLNANDKFGLNGGHFLKPKFVLDGRIVCVQIQIIVLECLA